MATSRRVARRPAWIRAGRLSAVSVERIVLHTRQPLTRRMSASENRRSPEIPGFPSAFAVLVPEIERQILVRHVGVGFDCPGVSLDPIGNLSKGTPTLLAPLARKQFDGDSVMQRTFCVSDEVVQILPLSGIERENGVEGNLIPQALTQHGYIVGDPHPVATKIDSGDGSRVVLTQPDLDLSCLCNDVMALARSVCLMSLERSAAVEESPRSSLVLVSFQRLCESQSVKRPVRVGSRTMVLHADLELTFFDGDKEVGGGGV